TALTSKASRAYWSYAVTNTISGNVCGSSARASASPVMESIWMSRNSRCGGCARKASRALRLSPNSPRTCKSGSRAQHSRSVRRAVGSSSTITTSIWVHGSGDRLRVTGCFEARLVPVMQLRQTDLGNPDTGFQLPGLEHRALTKLYCKPFAHVAQSNSLAPSGRIGRYCIDHTQSQGLVLARDLHADHDRTGVIGQSMDDGILHQRLQNQARNPPLRQVLGTGNPHGQSVREALLLQLQVEPDELQLIAQPGKLPLARVQQPAQQVPELHHHRLRRGRIPGDLAADGVQKIEQGVR